MLIGRFEIHVGGIFQRRICRKHGLMAHAGINPDVDSFVAMLCAFRQTELVRERRVVELEPNIRAALPNECWQFSSASSIPRSRKSATMSAFASKTYLPTRFGRPHSSV